MIPNIDNVPELFASKTTPWRGFVEMARDGPRKTENRRGEYWSARRILALFISEKPRRHVYKLRLTNG